MKHLLDVLGSLKMPDVTLLLKLAEFITVIVGSVGVGLFKSRSTATDRANAAASRARADEEASRQRVLDNFKALVATFQTRVDDLTARLVASDVALAAERASGLSRHAQFVAFVRRYLRRHPNDCMDAEDIELLTSLGVEVIQVSRVDQDTATGDTRTC